MAFPFVGRLRAPLPFAAPLGILLLLLGTTPAWGLNCRQISQLVGRFLSQHYSTRVFDDEISGRTLQNLLQDLDPAKLYFLRSDVEEFELAYATKLDELLPRADCSAINTILRRYDERFTARQAKIRELIAAPFDFSVDEYVNLDRDELPYADTVEEQDERWRLQIKFQALRLHETGLADDVVRTKLVKRYELSEKYLREIDAMELASIFVNAFAAALDPHSSYFSPTDFQEFNIQTSLSLEGIGATLRSEDGLTKIQDLVPGGPAERSGLIKTGDTIMAVGQADGDFQDVVDMRLREVVQLIRGARGTEVRLQVLRDDKGVKESLQFTLVRDKIELKDAEAKAWIYPVEAPDGAGGTREMRVGVIRLPSFYIDFEGRRRNQEDFNSSSRDVRRLINELSAEGVDSLVVDLRFNTGGSLDEAVDIGGFFVPQGPMVQVRNFDGSSQVLNDLDPSVAYRGPLVVLINRQSASASEIFAGAMKDYGRGLIVGDTHTFGKGTVQNVQPLAGGQYGAMKLTLSQFFRPGGSSTQLRGVDADIVLPDIMDELEIGEKFERYPLPWMEIPSARFEQENRVEPVLAVLRGASEQRVAGDAGFAEVRREMEEFRASKTERSRFSLKLGDEADDEAESAEAEAAAEADRDADRRPDLTEDHMLRETVAIAADYVQVLGGLPAAAWAVAEGEGVRLAAQAPLPMSDGVGAVPPANAPAVKN